MRGSTTTVYLEGLWEEVAGGAAKAYYTVSGQVVAVRNRTTNVVTYLHGDHLGSVSVVTTSGGAIASQQEYTPFGTHRGTSDITQTSLDYTGQRLGGTGLLYYHARMYDPALGRFVSPDSIVPGAASGAGGGAATLGLDSSSQLTPLSVDFHEPGFVAALNAENGLGFWFQLSDDERQQAGRPWGPANPQALNRYSYVLNNPLRYTDPTGHYCLDVATAPACAVAAEAAASAAGAAAVATAGVVSIAVIGTAGYEWAMDEPMPPYETPANYGVPAGDTTGIRATVPDGTGMGTTTTLDAPATVPYAEAKPQRARSPYPIGKRNTYPTKKG